MQTLRGLEATPLESDGVLYVTGAWSVVSAIDARNGKVLWRYDPAVPKDHAKFVGVRHITQDEPDDDFIISSDVIRGLKVLERHKVPFDLLFYVQHLLGIGHIRRAAVLARTLAASGPSVCARPKRTESAVT